MNDDQIILLYDGVCPFCQWLAELAQKRSANKIGIRSLQSMETASGETAKGPPPAQIAILHGPQSYYGAEAWAFLLSHHPDLKSLNWLGERLGWKTGVAKALDKVSYAARRMCYRCPR